MKVEILLAERTKEEHDIANFDGVRHLIGGPWGLDYLFLHDGQVIVDDVGLLRSRWTSLVTITPLN